MNKDETRILKVIKLIRDSFSESVATYTQGRCYHFACILKEIFGGELYHTESQGHVVVKIGEKFYDIKGNADDIYNDEYTKNWKKLTKGDEWYWDGNYHGAPTSVFVKKYKRQ